jgi:peptidoglycan/LPS O-acetylase OafA/YrhL
MNSVRRSVAPTRLPQLDALRGLAALSVGVWHHLSVLPSSGAPGPYLVAGQLVHALHYSPLYLLFAAHEAVILFFVLSGFVLMLPWTRGEALPYGAFIARRWARIYIPYAVALAIATTTAFVLRDRALSGLSEWVSYPWSKPVDLNLVLDHLLLVGTFDTGRLAPVFWTLVLEMRISLIFPLLAAFVMRTSWRAALISALAVSLMSSIVAAWLADVRAADVVGTLHYACLFALGALVAKHLDDLLTWWTALSTRMRTLTVLGALCCYAYGRCANLLMRPLGDWPAAAGVCLLFVFALGSRSATNVLVSRVPQFLGRISYSYYLLHAIVLIGLVHTFYGHFPLWAILSLSMVAGILVATASQRLVERPAIRLGRSMSELITKRRDSALAGSQ